MKTAIIAGMALLTGLGWYGSTNSSSETSFKALEKVIKCAPPQLEKKKDPIHIEVNLRFKGISPTEINALKNVYDIVDPSLATRVQRFHGFSLIPWEGDRASHEVINSDSENFTDAQLQRLKQMKINEVFMLKADYQVMDEGSGQLKWESVTPHVNIVPEKLAEPQQGRTQLNQQLYAAMQEVYNGLDLHSLEFGQIDITIGADGRVASTAILSSSGYTFLDLKAIELIKNIAPVWTPAEDQFGNPIPQHYFMTLGKRGC